MDKKTSPQAVQAVLCWRRRQRGQEGPKGRWDRGGRWWPTEDEEQDCCAHIRRPSRRWGASLYNHCKTRKHVARLYGVSLAEMRQAEKMLALAGEI